MLAFIFSVAYTCTNFRKAGFSKEVRQLVLKRHVITALAFMITNAYLLVNEIVFITSTPEDLAATFGTNYSWWAKTLKILFIS